MSYTTLSTKVYRARKTFNDDIYSDIKSWARDGFYSDDGKMIATQLEKDIVNLYLQRDKPWTIKPGELYERQFVVGDSVGMFRMYAAIAPIVHKYKIGYED